MSNEDEFYDAVTGRCVCVCVCVCVRVHVHACIPIPHDALCELWARLPACPVTQLELAVSMETWR